MPDSCDAAALALAASLGIFISPSVVFCNDAHGGTGVFTAASIKAGTVLIEAPYATGCLVGDSEEDLARRLRAFSSAMMDRGSDTAVGDGPWTVYAASLPCTAGAGNLSRFPSHTGVAFWQSQALSKLSREKRMSDESCDTRHYIWSRSIVHSRGFRIIGAATCALVPIVDLLNHSVTPTCVVERCKESIQIVAICDLSPGTELSHCYDRGRRNSQWLLRYDFAVREQHPTLEEVCCEDASGIPHSALFVVGIDCAEDSQQLRDAKRRSVRHSSVQQGEGLGRRRERDPLSLPLDSSLNHFLDEGLKCFVALNAGLTSHGGESRWGPTEQLDSAADLGTANSRGSIQCHWGLLLVLCRVRCAATVAELPPLHSTGTTSNLATELRALRYLLEIAEARAAAVLGAMRIEDKVPVTWLTVAAGEVDSSHVIAVVAGELMVARRFAAFAALGIAVIGGDGAGAATALEAMRRFSWYLGDARAYLGSELLPLLLLQAARDEPDLGSCRKSDPGEHDIVDLCKRMASSAVSKQVASGAIDFVALAAVLFRTQLASRNARDV